MEMTGRFGTATPRLTLQAHAYVDHTAALRAHMETVLDTCGARPWERDPIDARIVADVRNGTGESSIANRKSEVIRCGRRRGRLLSRASGTSRR